MRRVAYLCEYPTVLGGERSLLTFLESRDAAGVDPVVVAPPEGRLAEELDALGVERIDWPRSGRHRAAELAPVLRRRDVRVVHANSLMTAEAAWTLRDLMDVRGVAHARDIMSLSPSRWSRLAELDRLVAVSEAVACWLRKSGIPAERIATIPNAVDPDQLRRASRTPLRLSDPGLTESASLVGCIGQISLRKGQDVFLEAAAIVAEACPEARFLVVGARYSRKAESERYERELRRRAESDALRGKVHFLGYRSDVPAILAALGVLVVPSRQEPLSRVLLEGLALGVPSVATAVGGTPEILTHEETGLLVAPDSPAAIADAVLLLLRAPELARALREAGPNRAHDFSRERQMGALRKLYDDLDRTSR